MPVVNIPGVGRVKFPDTMSDDEIKSASAKMYREKAVPPVPASPKPSVGSQLLRGATATLPVIGAVGGGMAGTGASPILGTAAGAGAGTALGEGFRQLINQFFLGDKPNPMGQVTSGVMTGLGTAALPIVAEGLSPSGVLGDIERTGTISPGRLGAEAIRRMARSVRPSSRPGPVLSRPPWQTWGDDPSAVTDAERATAGTIGRAPVTSSGATVQPAQADAWDRMLETARQARTPQEPPILRKGGSAPPATNAAPTTAESIQSALENARKPTPIGKVSLRPEPSITSAGTEGEYFSSGRPSTTVPQYDEVTGSAGKAGTVPRPVPPKPPIGATKSNVLDADQLAELRASQ